MPIAGVFSGTISIGTAIVAVLVLAVAGWFASKYKLTEVAQRQTQEWRDSYMAERVRADDWEKRYQEQRSLKHDALNELAAARLKTDLSGLMQLMVKNFATFDQRIGRLEELQREEVATLKEISATQHVIAQTLRDERA